MDSITFQFSNWFLTSGLYAFVILVWIILILTIVGIIVGLLNAPKVMASVKS